jgi:hypothetical protein
VRTQALTALEQSVAKPCATGGLKHVLECTNSTILHAKEHKKEHKKLIGLSSKRTLPGAGPMVRKLRMETSLKSQASDWLKWRLFTISANQMLEICEWFQISVYNLQPRAPGAQSARTT